MFATVGRLAALHERARTGRGRHVDVSMTDGLVSWMSVMVGPVMNGARRSTSRPSRPTVPSAAPTVALLTLSIAHEDWFWRPLCTLLDMDDVAGLGRRSGLRRTRPRCAQHRRRHCAAHHAPPGQSAWTRLRSPGDRCTISTRWWQILTSARAGCSGRWPTAGGTQPAPRRAAAGLRRRSPRAVARRARPRRREWRAARTGQTRLILAKAPGRRRRGLAQVSMGVGGASIGFRRGVGAILESHLRTQDSCN